MTTVSQRTWMITGANRGLGLAFTQAALGAGDRVAATVRSTALTASSTVSEYISPAPPAAATAQKSWRAMPATFRSRPS